MHFRNLTAASKTALAVGLQYSTTGATAVAEASGDVQ